ncbi:MAG: hypothetical protein ABW005_11870 [Burkholderiaceae bacterium]
MISSVTAAPPVVQPRLGTDVAPDSNRRNAGSNGGDSRVSSAGTAAAAASAPVAAGDDTTVVNLSSTPAAPATPSSSTASGSGSGSGSGAQGLDRYKTVLDYEAADANQDGTVAELERRSYVLEHPSLEPRVSAEATRAYQSVGQSR